MSSVSPSKERLEFRPLTSDRWSDLERLFGRNGACGGCWCMWWRLTRSEFARNAGVKNKRLMKGITESGEVPGILAYANAEPIGWCSVAPREAYPVLDRSPTLKRIDDRPAWSVVCFFVAKRFRSRGITGLLLQAAVNYARERGAELIEGYPIEPKRNHRLSGSEGFTGIVSVFRKVGFSEAVRRSKNRPIMRYYVRRW